MRITDVSHIHEGLEDFKRKKGIRKIIAFSGGSSIEKSDLDGPEVENYRAAVEERVRSIIDAATRKLADFSVAVLTGGTRDGVPEYAAKIAKKYGRPTIGVYPDRGEKRALPDETVDLRIRVPPLAGPSCWGDETALFSKFADGLIVIGGGSGTLAEVSHVLKINESLISNGERAKPIALIGGVPGIGPILRYLPIKRKVHDATFPPQDFYEGEPAAGFLIERMSLYDDLIADAPAEA